MRPYLSPWRGYDKASVRARGLAPSVGLRLEHNDLGRAAAGGSGHEQPVEIRREEGGPRAGGRPDPRNLAAILIRSDVHHSLAAADVDALPEGIEEDIVGVAA